MSHFKTLLLTSILSISAATTAFAAPQTAHQQQNHQQTDQKRLNHGDHKQQQNKNQPQHADQKNKTNNHWKVGAKVPEKYRSNSYNINHSNHKLPKPEKNQRWIKVNNQYILENVLTHVIIKVITG